MILFEISSSSGFRSPIPDFVHSRFCTIQGFFHFGIVHSGFCSFKFRDFVQDEEKEEKLEEWYEQNKTLGNLGPAERTRKQDPGLDRMQDLSSAARADRGDAVREPEPNNCQSLNAGCGSPAVFIFFSSERSSTS